MTQPAPNLLIVDIFLMPERHGEYFAQEGNRFWDLLEETASFPNANTEEVFLEEFNVQFTYFYDQEYTGLREIEYADTIEAVEDFRNRILQLQPQVVLLVGNHISQFLDSRDTTPDFKGFIGKSSFLQIGNGRAKP